MTITVKRIAAAECLPKRFEYEVPEGTTIRELIGMLSKEYGAELRGELLKGDGIAEGILIMHNGLSLYQPDVSLEDRLGDGDAVFITTMVYGG